MNEEAVNMAKYKDEPWFKLSRRLFESSIWEEDLPTRIVWLTLLALAQEPANRAHSEGAVIITPGNLMRKAYVTRDQFEEAIARLTAPDPHSRTDPGKARLELLENGYRIPAFALYNDRDSYDRWKEQKREAGKRRAEGAVREGGKFARTVPQPAEYFSKETDYEHQ